jgi:hypothetical protein
MRVYIACALLEAIPSAPSWVNRNQVQIATNARLISAQSPNLNYKELLLEAISEFKTKWRFISLYRVLEHGYLSEIFQTLTNSFFSAPKDSLKVAAESVQNELMQFVSFAEAASLQNQFEALYDEFELVKNAGNQFALALEHSIQQGGQQTQTKNRWQAGVLVCYKIRCAIVHAGLSAPVYDVYPDGPALLEALLPTFEFVALTFLGVTVL